MASGRKFHRRGGLKDMCTGRDAGKGIFRAGGEPHGMPASVWSFTISGDVLPERWSCGETIVPSSDRWQANEKHVSDIGCTSGERVGAG